MQGQEDFLNNPYNKTQRLPKKKSCKNQKPQHCCRGFRFICMQILLYRFYQLFKAGRFVHRQISKDLTIEVNILHLQFVDELRVR